MESPPPKNKDKCDEIDNDDLELEFYDLKRTGKDVYELTETLVDENKVNNLESIETNLNFDLLEKWMVKIFPRLKINFWKMSNYSDDDNISNEASYARLITILVFITVVLCFITIGQLIWISFLSRGPIVAQPFIPKMDDPFFRSFPMLHLAIISRNGTVWDLSFNEKVSLSKMFLFKLPKSCSCGYRGYSDDKGILNFIEGHLNRKFVQYHSSFNGNGVKTGIRHHIKGEVGWQKMANGKKMCYTQSLQFGNTLWLFGALALTSFGSTGKEINGDYKSYLFRKVIQFKYHMQHLSNGINDSNMVSKKGKTN